jgi:hypothetical protein
MSGEQTAPTRPEEGPSPREPCPCCGYITLSARDADDICVVCWWHDDGQDNADADIVRGGPNYELSLTQARANMLIHGMSNPRRTDLAGQRHAAARYELARRFVLSGTRSAIAEPATGWESSAFRISP